MRFENQTFRNATVELDFNEFARCRFEHCNVVVRGMSPLAFTECHFEGCNFHFDGPAAMTINVLRELYRSMPAVGELAIQAIKGEIATPKAH